MNLRRYKSLFHLPLVLLAIGAFAGTSYAQFSVTVTGTTPSGTPIPSGTSSPAASNQFKVKAAIAGNANPIAKVVFYRNDVPYITDTTFPYEITQDQLGQDTYTYHASGYDSTGARVDSNDYKLIFTTRHIIRMGDDSKVDTELPGRYVDHTQGVQDAVDWLGANGGGTLFFPCTIPGNDLIAIYNIKSTILLPSNVTLQGEGSELNGRCRIYWNDVAHIPPAPTYCGTTAPNLINAPMFKIVGGTSGVRFRDLWMLSRTTGPGCDNRNDWAVIAGENTAAVELNTDEPKAVGDVTDVIFENVTISHFTRGVSAVSDNSSEDENEISGIKIRAFKPDGNTTAIYINAKYAYNWDIQNFNPASLMPGQGAVQIINAGKPSVTDGENTKIKFLQMNCNGVRATPGPYCVQVQKHGGLYFRQLHHEGVDRAIVVEDISSRRGQNTNPDPIVFEDSVASGDFHDPSMKLYLIGNGITAAPEMFQAGLDDNRLRFKGKGRDSTVVDCGDVHWDWTDINAGAPAWEDMMMLFTHSERYRGSFFAETGNYSYTKPHTYCPAGVAGVTNIDEIGGEFFDSGVLPNEPGLYSYLLNNSTCPPGCNVANRLDWFLTLGGSVYVDGVFTLYRTVTIPRGSQIIGAPGAELILAVPNIPLLQLDAKILTLQNQIRLSGVAIRNLKLSTTQSGTTGIAFIGEHDTNPPPTGLRVGASSDIHFSGLTFDGFSTGIFAGPDAPGHGNPMIDGMSWKNMTFVNNATAMSNTSANSSNWNVMNLSMQSSSTNAVGWSQVYGGHQGLQDVTCTGAPSVKMKDCLRLQMVGGFYLNGLKQTTHVTNALTVGENGSINQNTIYQAAHPAVMVLRNSDFTSSSWNSGRMNVLGKAFITSMNNKYMYFNVESPYQGTLSRLTHCGDSYPSTPYPGLSTLHPNLWVGLETPTRVQCGARPIPYDDAVRWTNDLYENWVGTPLVGNFFSDTKEDFVVFKQGPPNKFLIQEQYGPGRLTVNVSLANGTPLIGRFFPNSRAQVVLYHNGVWLITDPIQSANNATWNWGMVGDKPLIGNFIDESGSVGGNKDEIAIFRPSTNMFWILNPRSGWYNAYPSEAPSDSELQVADFLGLGYDQIAQYKAGVWKIFNPRTVTTHTVNFSFGLPGDILVSGKYLPTLSGQAPCAQLGVWRSTTQEFIVADPFPNCGTRGVSMVWGANNGSLPDDVPLTINAPGSPTLRRPTSYRITKNGYDHSIADGQWWVHDLFP